MKKGQKAESEHHADIETHAAFVVGLIIPDIAEHYDLCLGCFGKEVIRQIEKAMHQLRADAENDKIGATEGNA